MTSPDHRHPPRLAFLFDELRLDHGRVPGEDWQILLWIVGRFSIIARGGEVYAEPEFCVVEFASALSGWLRETAGPRPAFEYVSMEADEPGLVWIRKVGDGWQPGSIHPSAPADSVFAYEEVEAAATRFLDDLRREVRARFGIEIGSLIGSLIGGDGPRV